MLLTIDKKVKYISSLVLATFIFTGCSSKSSNNAYYGDYRVAKSFEDYKEKLKTKKVFKDVPKQKIKNSKAMHRATMRPYKVLGKWYYPKQVKIGDIQTGIASWYGPDFHAKKTSNGEIYNMFAQTAAHKTLPMNTMVKVYNLDNGKETIVRVNDRGPFVDGRIIDLSNKAAHDIDMVKKGTAKVKLEILGFHAKIARTSEERKETLNIGKFYIQVGAFSRVQGAKITKSQYEQKIDSKYNVIIKSVEINNKTINRVWIGDFRSEEEINDFKNKYNIQGSVIAQ